MVIYIKEIGLKIELKEEGFLDGKILISMMVISMMIKWMVKEFSRGILELSIKEVLNKE